MELNDLPWPAQREAAVSLTFDDGMASQLAVAVPTLEEHNLRGTFYINTGDEYVEKLTPWIDAATVGHEIGNHTVWHPCAHNFAFVRGDGRRTLEEMTLADMDDEIRLAQERLMEVLPLTSPNSFAYPCYQPYVGSETMHTSYVPLVAEQFVAGRGLGEGSNHPNHCQLAYLWSYPCERRTGAELIGLVEQAASVGDWVILTFHGINEGNLAVAESDLRTLCVHLARHSERLWAAPVATVAHRVVEWRRGIG